MKLQICLLTGLIKAVLAKVDNQLTYLAMQSEVLVILVLACLTQAGHNQDRNGRMFDQYVSTSAITSTISTSSICFMTSDAAPVTCKKRKRAVLEDKPGWSVDEKQSEDIRPGMILSKQFTQTF